MAIANLLLAGWTAAMPAPAPEASGCQVERIIELPITMVNRRPMIAAKFGIGIKSLSRGITVQDIERG